MPRRNRVIASLDRVHWAHLKLHQSSIIHIFQLLLDKRYRYKSSWDKRSDALMRKWRHRLTTEVVFTLVPMSMCLHEITSLNTPSSYVGMFNSIQVSHLVSVQYFSARQIAWDLSTDVSKRRHEDSTLSGHQTWQCCLINWSYLCCVLITLWLGWPDTTCRNSIWYRNCSMQLILTCFH